MSSAAVSRFQLLVAAVLFSTGGAAIKATSFTGWQVASFRSLAAAAAVLLLVPASRHDWRWRTLLVGTAYAATLVLYVLANKLTTAANAIFLQATAPLYLLLIGPWLLQERIKRSDVVLMAVLMGGMTLFFVGEQDPSHTAPDPFQGNLLALLSGVTWALTIAGLRWIQRHDEGRQPGMAMVVAGNLIAGLSCLPNAVPVTAAGYGDWLVVVYLGVFQIGLAYAFLTRAVRRIPALEASLLLLVEPALNPVWALLVHGERPHALALLGGVLILAASLARSAAQTRQRT
jgi:drug/metabolite transporter, DME family